MDKWSKVRKLLWRCSVNVHQTFHVSDLLPIDKNAVLSYTVPELNKGVHQMIPQTI